MGVHPCGLKAKRTLNPKKNQSNKPGLPGTAHTVATDPAYTGFQAVAVAGHIVQRYSTLSQYIVECRFSQQNCMTSHFEQHCRCPGALRPDRKGSKFQADIDFWQSTRTRALQGTENMKTTIKRSLTGTRWASHLGPTWWHQIEQQV
jgi:hypothetical protein